ncbi:MAG TPA: cytochrome c oxidase subunit II [Azospirillaceae bacterium]|nr:cytochrome c oxidase subunit II [Azospirillaceae bacterium]
MSAIFDRIVAGVLLAALPSNAQAQTQAEPPVLGVAHPWQLWHQTPATSVMEQLDGFHQMLLYIMVAICVLVAGLLAYVLFRFNASRNPTPSRTSHNTLIEIIWTTVPVIILVIIAIPSFRILYYMDRTANPELTLKVTGRQWYWDYEYPDQGGLSFSSFIIPEEEIKPGQHRLLEVDRRVVLPVDTNIRILLTGGDVIHAWAMPAFGIKMDAIPGHLNETWARIEREGVYYGQCSEICGTAHAYMPVAVEAVSKERFAQWVEQAKQAASRGEPPPPSAIQLADLGGPSRRDFKE